MSNLVFNEYDQLRTVALRSARAAFESDLRITHEWEPLRFHEPPEIDAAILEHTEFVEILLNDGADIHYLSSDDTLTLDSIYTRDSLIVSPDGLIRCSMGRRSRNQEPQINASALERLGFHVTGEIVLPGTLEGGDFIWLDRHTAAVGLGPRTNSEGIRQLQEILGSTVELHIVPLPQPDHPEDVFHLMSMISPLDHDLALIYRPLMPAGFIRWLASRNIQFVDVPETEFVPMGCNVLATGPRRLLMLDKLPLTREKLMAAGCTVRTYKGDEISRKGEGGPTCLTRPLTRVASDDS